MIETASATPGVRIPPPLIFITGLGAGLALDYGVSAWPLAGPGGVLFLRVLAGAFALLAAVLLANALGAFRRKGNDPRPWREDAAFVAEGLYRYTRNPMYLGMTAIFLSLTLAFNSAWPLLTLLPTLAVVRYYVIAREEAYLAKRFGATYLDYCARVRRWV